MRCGAANRFSSPGKLQAEYLAEQQGLYNRDSGMSL